MLGQNDALLQPFNFQPLFQGTRRKRGNLVIHQTSVESVELGKTLDLSTSLSLVCSSRYKVSVLGIWEPGAGA